MAKLVVGCGYLGCRVAVRWLEQGHVVYALTRSPSGARHLAELGLRPLIGDWTSLASLPSLPAVDTVLCSVGWDRHCGKSVHEVYVHGLGNLLHTLPPECERLLYISSTGVYGQSDGGWIDERSSCQPRRAGGRACLAAEQLLFHGPWAARAIVLRLAGIYGPGRLPRRGDVAAGRPLDASAEALLNLIHVDDATSAILRAAELSLSLPDVILVADGHPVRRRTFYEQLARLVGAPRPRFTQPTHDRSAAAERSVSSKRVSNQRMIHQLGVKLRYPSFREGLAAIVG